jgi:hypothetical protein
MLDQLKEIYYRVKSKIIGVPNQLHGIILLLILIVLILK